MDLNNGQQRAVQLIKKHLDFGGGVFYLAGWAGTGKTTTVSRALSEYNGMRVAVVAPTGKAAHVLQKKGLRAQTLHSLIYKPMGQTWACTDGCDVVWETEEEEDLVRSQKCKDDHGVKASRLSWGLKEELPEIGGIVVDESSMVNQQMGSDLLSFGLPVVALGDPFQLPPVEGKGWLLKNREPDAMLTELMRFENGQTSGVVDLATRVREGRPLPAVGERGVDFARMQTVPWTHKKFLDDSRDQMIIVATHAKRFSINTTIRRAKWGRSVGALPVAGDRLICKRNDRELGLFNGQPLVATRDAVSIGHDAVMVYAKTEDGRELVVNCWEHWFTEPKAQDAISALGPKSRRHGEISYGYAITGHSAQGSEWDSVTVDATRQRWMGDVWPRWLYTSITRAREAVNVIG